MSERVNEQQPDAVKAITVVKATNTDRTEIVFGDVTDRIALQRPELVDGLAVAVKRLYDPIGSVRFDAPREREEVQEWLNEQPQRGPLADHDYESQNHDVLVGELLATRRQHQGTITDIRDDLLRALESEDTEASVKELAAALNDTINEFQPTAVDAVPVGDGDQEGKDA